MFVFKRTNETGGIYKRNGALSFEIFISGIASVAQSSLLVSIIVKLASLSGITGVLYLS